MSDNSSQMYEQSQSENGSKTIDGQQLNEITVCFKDFRAIIDHQSIDPLAMFYSQGEESQGLNQALDFELDEEFYQLRHLVKNYGEHHAKVEIDSLKELQIINLFQKEQILNQRKSLLIHLNNVSHFYLAQGAGESKIDLIRSQHNDSTMQLQAQKIIQKNHNNQIEFIQAVEGLIISTIEQLKSKDYLIIEYKLVVQQSILRFHSYLKKLQEFCTSDDILITHIRKIKTEAKKQPSQVKIQQIVKEKLNQEENKETDDDPHHVMKHELNQPSNSSLNSNNCTAAMNDTFKEIRKGAGKNRSRTPKRIEKAMPDSQRSYNKRTKKQNDKMNLYSQKIQKAIHNQMDHGIDKSQNENDSEDDISVKKKKNGSQSKRNVTRSRGRPKQNQTQRQALLQKADRLNQLKKQKKQVPKQKSSEEDADDSSQEHEQEENDPEMKSVSGAQKKSKGSNQGSKKSNDNKSGPDYSSDQNENSGSQNVAKGNTPSSQTNSNGKGNGKHDGTSNENEDASEEDNMPCDQ